jgi:hypothetical protein
MSNESIGGPLPDEAAPGIYEGDSGDEDSALRQKSALQKPHPIQAAGEPHPETQTGHAVGRERIDPADYEDGEAD